MLSISTRKSTSIRMTLPDIATMYIYNERKRAGKERGLYDDYVKCNTTIIM